MNTYAQYLGTVQYIIQYKPWWSHTRGRWPHSLELLGDRWGWLEGMDGRSRGPATNWNSSDQCRSCGVCKYLPIYNYLVNHQPSYRLTFQSILTNSKLCLSLAFFTENWRSTRASTRYLLIISTWTAFFTPPFKPFKSVSYSTTSITKMDSTPQPRRISFHTLAAAEPTSSRRSTVIANSPLGRPNPGFSVPRLKPLTQLKSGSGLHISSPGWHHVGSSTSSSSSKLTSSRGSWSLTEVTKP